MPGVTTDMLASKAVVIAGALRRPAAMVHLSQAPSGVPGHVEILVLDIDPATQKPTRYAYLNKKPNVGSPCTIGYDPRNRPIRWMLPGTNGITTGTPGSGKTAYLIQLALLAGRLRPFHADDVAELRQEHLVIGPLRTTLPGGPSGDESIDNGVGGHRRYDAERKLFEAS